MATNDDPARVAQGDQDEPVLVVTTAAGRGRTRWTTIGLAAAAVLMVAAGAGLVVGLTRDDPGTDAGDVEVSTAASDDIAVEPTTTTSTAPSAAPTEPVTTTAPPAPDVAPPATAPRAASAPPPPPTTAPPSAPSLLQVPAGIELIIGTAPAPGSPTSAVDNRWFLAPGGVTYGTVPVGLQILYAEGTPDYVVVTIRGGGTVAGYAKKGDLALLFSMPDGAPVYDNDGVTLLGHLVTDWGFVPLGETPGTTVPPSGGGS